ncbi:hypothetical protein DID88_005051 [Monilinia fructigena]|uniref:Uncharacterized protein n=1 Tax=Monilinia fructigena TaxID=38457 RepID=A0A395IQZ8_9HELO|nr:hypothetical protein DID88_005051 [Monilinia fructigena]
MGTPSQTSSSSSRSSNQYLSTPSTTSKSHSAPASTSQKVHPGSNASQKSSCSSGKSSPSSSSRSSHKVSADQKPQDEAIKRYENEPRDYKSWVVEQYDDHQEQASDEHWNSVERDVNGVEWAR